MRHLVFVALLVSCKGGSGGDPTGTTPMGGTPTGTATGTGTGTGSTPAAVLDASCEPSENPWAVVCDATLASVGAATLELTSPGLPTRSFTTEQLATDHQIHGWGLRADTTYDWSIGEISGQLTTGPIPDLLSGLNVTTTGELFGIDGVLVYTSCGMFVIVDGEGELIGGLYTEVYDAFTDGMMWSQPDRSLIVTNDATMTPGPSEYQELAIWGDELGHMVPGEFALDLTHDVGRWGPYTYLLGAQGSAEGFEVMQGTTSLGIWLMPDAFPGVTNTHLNGLFVSDQGEVILSDRNYSSVVAVDGDPASASFLQLNWHAEGELGVGYGDADYRPPGGVLFDQQHNASRHGDELWVFDNLSQPEPRALRMAMDHANGLVTEIESWTVPGFCPNQGGAMKIDEGVLATCGNTGDVLQFREGESTAAWTMSAFCGGGGGGGAGRSTRAFPVIVE